ncbi:MAG: hypothetical protein ACI8Y4_005162 [Candidatus Poriferisodalaceae bacterium]
MLDSTRVNQPVHKDPEKGYEGPKSITNKVSSDAVTGKQHQRGDSGYRRNQHPDYRGVYVFFLSGRPNHVGPCARAGILS